MALNDQQFGQLKMFMTGDEIKRSYTSGDAIAMGGSQEQTWKSKLAETKRGWDYVEADEVGKGPNYGWKNLAHEIDREGVKTPVHIYHGYQNRVMPKATSLVYDGHHRAAYEADAHPDRYLPVWHSDDANYRPAPGSDR